MINIYYMSLYLLDPDKTNSYSGYLHEYICDSLSRNNTPGYWKQGYRIINIISLKPLLWGFINQQSFAGFVKFELLCILICHNSQWHNNCFENSLWHIIMFELSYCGSHCRIIAYQMSLTTSKCIWNEWYVIFVPYQLNIYDIWKWLNEHVRGGPWYIKP